MILDRQVQKTREWLTDVQERGEYESLEDAYTATRAVLQAQRDRLPVDEIVHLSAQLPLVLKGVLFDGYSYTESPPRFDTEQQFYDRVREHAQTDLDPQRATQAVLGTLKSRVAPGEIQDVRSVLPDELAGLWDAAAAA